MRQADLQVTFSLGDPNNQADPPEHNGVTEEEWDALAPREKLAIVAISWRLGISDIFRTFIGQPGVI